MSSQPSNGEPIDADYIVYEDCYLGDGVYASFDGFHFVLDLRAQDASSRICLDPDVMKALKKYERDTYDKITAFLNKETQGD